VPVALREPTISVTALLPTSRCIAKKFEGGKTGPASRSRQTGAPTAGLLVSDAGGRPRASAGHAGSFVASWSPNFSAPRSRHVDRGTPVQAEPQPRVQHYVPNTLPSRAAVDGRCFPRMTRRLLRAGTSSNGPRTHDVPRRGRQAWLPHATWCPTKGTRRPSGASPASSAARALEYRSS
jgi:hypothetical protein